MKEKFPKIYKNKVENLKSKVQKEYYYHSNDSMKNDVKENNGESNSEMVNHPSHVDLRNKINSIFKRPDYVYKADVNIMYKNGETMTKKVIGFKDNYLIISDGEKIHISKINDIN